MSEKDEAVKEIGVLTERRAALKQQIAELEEQRRPIAEGLEEAKGAVVILAERLTAVDAKLAEARLPLQAELEQVKGELRAAHLRHQSAALSEVEPTDDSGMVLSAPGIESEEAVGPV